MLPIKAYSFWFITGSQHLYGPETLEEAARHSRTIVDTLNARESLPYQIAFKPIVTTPDEIRNVCVAANSDPDCAGIITWMHTFSPSKMWITGLASLKKPLLHLHTQYNRNIPWDTIDMDFMNLNQSAHGDREHGFIGTRMGIARKVIAGYWEDVNVQRRIGIWMQAAAAYAGGFDLKLARFGDNMREVAVTEGDKVEAQIKFGWSVNGYGVGDLVESIKNIGEDAVDQLMAEYASLYEITDTAKTNDAAVREQARIELGMRSFLNKGGFTAFTTTFEDLHGLRQLPGLAVQRLMADGFGFGGEGDWKTSALVRIMKIMAMGKDTSFMEDYTYHLEDGNEMILGAHMLEVCPSIAGTRPRVEVHPLGIGGKEAPARLVFDGHTGPAICASLVDMGGRMRLIVSQVNAIAPSVDMPRLPVARVLWKPEPSLSTAAEAWILAGGAHHTCFSYAVTTEHLVDWAEMTGIEVVIIDDSTRILNFRNELRLNDLYWKLR